MGSEDAILAVLEALEAADPAAVKALAEEIPAGLPSLAKLLRVARKLDEAGVLDALEVLAENIDAVIAALARPETVGALEALAALAKALAGLPPGALERLAEEAPALARLALGD